MFQLIGQVEDVCQHEIGGSFESEFSEEVIALFSSFQAAEQYIVDSRLVRVRHESFAGDRAFHSRSLLGACCDAWVVQADSEELPIDPQF